MRIALRLSGLAATLMLAACGNILPQPAPPPALYRLTPAADFAPGPQVAAQLAVEAPLAEAALDRTRIALARSPTTLDYFADAAWTERLSPMVQSLLIASLDNAHRLAAVGPPSTVIRADAVLVTELRHFEAIYRDTATPRWRIELEAKLIKVPERTILSDRRFTAEEEVPRNAVPAIVDTADSTWRSVAKDVADWTAATLAQAYPAARK